MQKPVVEPPQDGTGSNLANQGRYCSASVVSWSYGADSGVDVGKVGPEVTVKDCGVTVAMLQGHSRAPTLSTVQARTVLL